MDTSGNDTALGGILLFLFGLIGTFHGQIQLSGGKGIGMVCFGSFYIQKIETVLRFQYAVRIVKLQVVFACGVQISGCTVEVLAEVLLGVFPPADLLVRPFTEALSHVGCQKIHGFVEASSIG